MRSQPRTPWKSHLISAVAWCLPARCLACRAELPPIAPLSLCPPCRLRLRMRSTSTCRTCSREMSGHPDGPGDLPCERCRREPPPFDRLSSLWRYDEPARSIVHGLKFSGLRYLGRHLAEAMLSRFEDEVARADVIVPVPLHPWRLATRGYNQAAEIARPLAAIANRPLSHALVRRRATRPQRRLDRAARMRNLERAFRMRRLWPPGWAPPQLGRALLVDDVVTTGATATAAARALLDGGAESVSVLVAARTLHGTER